MTMLERIVLSGWVIFVSVFLFGTQHDTHPMWYFGSVPVVVIVCLVLLLGGLVDE